MFPLEVEVLLTLRLFCFRGSEMLHERLFLQSDSSGAKSRLRILRCNRGQSSRKLALDFAQVQQLRLYRHIVRYLDP